MMAHSRLHVLRRRSAGGVEADSIWLEASSTEAAIAQARSATDTVLAEAEGIALLMKDNVVLWSERRGMPRPDHFRVGPLTSGTGHRPNQPIEVVPVQGPQSPLSRGAMAREPAGTRPHPTSMQAGTRQPRSCATEPRPLIRSAPRYAYTARMQPRRRVVREAIERRVRSLVRRLGDRVVVDTEHSAAAYA